MERVFGMLVSSIDDVCFHNDTDGEIFPSHTHTLGSHCKMYGEITMICFIAH